MPDSNLTVLDETSSHWLAEVQQATLSSMTCPVPKKYFDALFTWGYVSGSATAARLSPFGLSSYIAGKQQKTKSKSTKKSKRK